jgi:spore photoproduct lyase
VYLQKLRKKGCDIIKQFIPKKVYYEPEIIRYDQGLELLSRYRSMGIETIEIKSHNKIEELRNMPSSRFVEMKGYLILGIRKTLKLIPNELSADFIVPFTSSGCSAMCLYCYLVCNFFNNSYLRIFLNREEMLNEVRKKAIKLGEHKVYELGCNSDMVLENTITGNLNWAIEEFGRIENATATLATKFSMVDSLLNLNHNGHTQIRMSVNPDYIIRKVEIGTSLLKERIEAANKLFRAGYRVGLNVAPIILINGWEVLYREMFETLNKNLDEGLKSQLFFELIFMTYGYANKSINKEAFPNAIDVFEQDKMKPKGRSKMNYKNEVKDEAEIYFRELIYRYFPEANISYIV